ncbi:MAG: hypothetical protein IID08_09115 [Candidatus Hydrogenedentes bacterium]|nr:hypothetical protein [Candidatus Hydrogenedentota bacterium]
MEEDKRDEVVPEQPQGNNGRVVGGLVGGAIGLFIASSMTMMTTAWGLWFWVIVVFVVQQIGVRFGKFIPKVSGLAIFLLITLCVVAAVGPIGFQHVRFNKIVDQLSDFPSAELKELHLILFAYDGYPGFTAEFRIDANAQDVVEYYNESLKKSGWVIIGHIVDNERSLAVAEYELPGKYILDLRKFNERLLFGLSVTNFANDPPRSDLVRTLDRISGYYHPPRYPEP